ncbi:MAG TPA: ATP-binding cassette domain-containing protein [Ilumatobacteraceae bacterium]|nr:ATP-binding cassette domain-containing protein [Ilumatobacteraceae bacterium]HRB03541.1 ATP-binding cassette domain-containing protein [Ilumatobacteraceae bacterium]
MTDTAILADRLRKTFDDVVAVDQISLAVPRGTVLGLLGVNGAGKTTMVRMLTTVLKPTSGRGVVNGFDVLTEQRAVRRNIGLAGQYAAVDENLTGRENLILVGRLTHLSKAAARQRATELLDQFRLTDAADRPVRTYSGGMRRRLDLGAALVTHPPVLFLDEPTTGLDPASRLDLWAVIETLVSDGTTVLLTTQYLEEADRLADNIVVIDKGLIAAEGTTTQLKARLGDTVIEFELDDAMVAASAAAVVGGTVAAGTVVRLVMSHGPVTLRDAMNQLLAADITPVKVALREPTLDDVFLTLTGNGGANS